MNDTNKDLRRIINPSAFQRISPFVTKPYQLNQEGTDFVVRSNEALPEVYFEHLLFPVTPFWGSYFEDKLNLLKPKNLDVMVDVCCGTGTLCLNVMPKMGYANCVAIDNSAVAIDVLRNRVQPHQHIDAFKQDITKMHFDDHSIDAIYGNSFLHHLPDNYTFLSETFRVLRGGGLWYSRANQPSVLHFLKMSSWAIS